ncbi:MAG: phosphoserine phosphatase SerB [Shewanella sp.]|nr:phosphoserine phosphatase SerB [Shewanella sp.]MCF1457553.1 phosphoserine phosphatase SerB [Shewanella sp.]
MKGQQTLITRPLCAGASINMDSQASFTADNLFPLWFYQLTQRTHPPVHTEPQGAGFTYRYRLIWQDDGLKAELMDWLSGLDNTVSLCPLVRQNALTGVELGSKKTIAHQTFNGVEWFELTSPLAFLTQPGLLLMDMDSTAIEIECIDELAAMAGRGEEVAAITEQAMQGELDFEQSLRQRVAALAGADAAIIDKLCHQLPLMPGLQQMVAELQSYGWRVALASGGFMPFVNHLKQQLDLIAAFANHLVVRDGQLIGEVEGRIVDAAFKAEVLTMLANQYGIARGQRLAIGDGANDIPMIQAADFGIAFHARPKLKQAADAAIEQLDLRVIPFLMSA